MTDAALQDRIRAGLRDVPDFPEPGVTFKDITPLLADAELFAAVVEAHAEPWRGKVDRVAGLEARGFIFGAAIALHLGLPADWFVHAAAHGYDVDTSRWPRWNPNTLR